MLVAYMQHELRACKCQLISLEEGINMLYSVGSKGAGGDCAIEQPGSSVPAQLSIASRISGPASAELEGRAASQLSPEASTGTTAIELGCCFGSFPHASVRLVLCAAGCAGGAEACAGLADGSTGCAEGASASLYFDSSSGSSTTSVGYSTMTRPGSWVRKGLL